MKERISIAVVILVVVVVYFCLIVHAHGQGFTPRRPFILQSAAAVNTNHEPQNLPHMYLWWVASDTLTQGTNVAITNWVDRVQGWIWTNETAGTRPQNSTTGIVFNGSSQFLTNVVPVDLHSAVPSSYAAVFTILKWVPNANVSPVPFGYQVGSSYAENWFHIGDWAWNFSYGPPGSGCNITAPIVTNQLMTICSINTSTNEFFFTNGVICKLGACFGGPRFNYMGYLPSTWYFPGTIVELIVYTNLIDGTYVTNLQHYASTNYGVPYYP